MKPVHEICVDKTSCKAELDNKKTIPTGHMTKDTIRKQYQESQGQKNL
jgi:hypothetical protein